MKRNPIRDPRVGDRVRPIAKNPWLKRDALPVETVEAICGNLIATRRIGGQDILWQLMSEWCKTDTLVKKWVVVGPELKTVKGKK